MSLGATRYTATPDRQGVTYGPAVGADGYVLTVLTEDGRVAIEFPEEPMYDLWVEVRGVPWPEPDKHKPAEHDRLVRRLVQLANGADEEMLEEAVRALGGSER